MSEFQFEEYTVKKKYKWIKIIILIFFIAIAIFFGIKTAIFSLGKIREQQRNNKGEENISNIVQNETKEEKKEKNEQQNIVENSEPPKEEKNNQTAMKPLSQEQIEKVENLYKTEEGEKTAYLTFDDGPTKAVTPKILDILKQENVKATFFVLGGRVVTNQGLVKRAYEEGHYIANHSFSHTYSNIYSSVDATIEEYTGTETAIKEVLGEEYNSRLFRFPGGLQGGYYAEIKKQAAEKLKQMGVANIDWNALTYDAAGAKTKEEEIEKLKQTVEDKHTVVILMHDAADKKATYEALPEIISYLREKGYTFKNFYDVFGK